MKGPGTKSGGFGSKKIDTTPKTSGKTFILNKKPDKENKSSNQPVAKDPTESGNFILTSFGMEPGPPDFTIGFFYPLETLEALIFLIFLILRFFFLDKNCTFDVATD